MLNNDSLLNVLYVDLSKKSFSIKPRPDLFDKYIGGTGVAIQLLHEECPANCDPFDPDNPIILAVGPMTGLFPLGSKTVAIFKSPLTGNLGESHCGGRSAVAIRMAGYGAIVIKGASKIPLYLAVHGNKIFFRDASTLWGMGSSFSVGRIIRENESGAGLRTIMRIGRAGEKLIKYACVTSETYRHFGRLGLGAVFGSKKLKAITISGKSSIPVTNMKEYKKTYNEVYQAAVESPLMKKYHDLGTAENIRPLNEFGGLPVQNLQKTRFDKTPGVAGEALAEDYLGRRLACSNCPVGCIHIAALREPYEDEAYFYKTSMISYDYEPIYSLGTMLGITDPEGFLKLMDRIEAWALDAMSAGVVLAWATEALERGIITDKETEGIKLKWGDYESYISAARLIIEQPNKFYKDLGQGVAYAASQYGGEDFALAFGKNEMPGYHTGPAAHIGVLIGARHSHLDNGGYSVDQKTLAKNPMNPEELVDSLVKEEKWRQILSSLVVCFFARALYKPDLIVRALSLSGFDFNEDDLNRIGEQIYNEKIRYKMQEGFSFDNMQIPSRIFETPTPVREMSREYILKALEHAKRLIANT
ncbi:MAG: aldehyde ferredoxin oxidoreductase family protein [bacterium]